MQKYFLIILSCFGLTFTTFGQVKPYKIITLDIDNFWMAFDSLTSVHSSQDSLYIVQRNYIDKASDGLKEFFKARPYTAKDYVHAISAYPRFWKSLRSNTLQVKNQKPSIEKIYATYKNYLPDFTPPNICFAIGVLNTGGTTTKNWILVGTEIVTADSSVDKSELSNALKAILYQKDAQTHISSIIAHELVHTQQAIPKEPTLYGMIISEGSADFIPDLLLKLTINPKTYQYGQMHECELWEQFQKDVDNNAPACNWLYNGGVVKDKPADLGYFIGEQICKSYYDKAENKKLALKDILQDTDYFKLVNNSDYNGKCSR